MFHFSFFFASCNGRLFIRSASILWRKASGEAGGSGSIMRNYVRANFIRDLCLIHG